MTREPVGTGAAERPVTGFPADVPALARVPLPLLSGPLVAIAAVGLVADVAWAGLEAFADPLTALVGWAGDHRWAVTGVMLTIAATQWLRRRRAPEEASVVGVIEELEEESAR